MAMDAIRVLYVEDNPWDVELTQRHLQRYAPHVKVIPVGTVAEAIERLPLRDVDVVLCDYRLPDGNGLDVLQAVEARRVPVAVVLITGAGDTATAILLLKAGATDYVVKRGDYLRSLPQVLEGAIESYQAVHELRHATVRVLYGEHDQADVELTERAFHAHGAHLRLEVAPTGREVLERLRRSAYDLVLLDYRLPDVSGIEVLRSLRQERIRVPVVMVTGQGDEETAAQAFKLGASDYIVKGQGYLAKLPSTVENVLARRRLENERNALVVLNALSVALASLRDARELAERVARSARDLLNADIGIVWLREDEGLRLLASSGLDATGPLVDARLAERLAQGLPTARRLTAAELQAVIGSSPEVRELLEDVPPLVAVSLVSSGRLVGLLAVGGHESRELGPVEERLLIALANHAAIAVENLRLYQGLAEQVQARNRLSAVLEATTDLVGIVEPSGALLYLNRAGRRLMGIEPEEDIGRVRIAGFVAAETRDRVGREIVPQLTREGTWSGELLFRSRSGRDFPVWAVASAHQDPPHSVQFLSVIARDITVRRDLEAELRQAQKMESVGRLAAGIAHDFNNLLTVIGGRCHLVLSQLAPDSPMLRDLSLVQGAAERAVRLTRQLLAFSRKQVLELCVLDLNAAVRGIEPLLRRVIGEDVEVSVVAAPELGHVKADPGQLEQVLLNMAVNARDAMPRGGRLTIETANVVLDESYTRRFPDVVAGRYVMIAIGDTGHGMDAATVARVFEPFFTTKEPGKGTGLGLATVYGIVKQSHGHIDVTSQPGHGTTFKVYLPEVDEVPLVAEPEAAPARAEPRGSETILLIEDDEDVRMLAREVLKLGGYAVLDVQSPTEGLRIARQHRGPIHLVLTDVVMPGMSGHEVAARLRTARPDLKVLFMSGYADSGVDGQEGGGSALTSFIQKPFTPEGLGRKVREVLAPPA